MYHTIIIAGNVGKDPENKKTPSGIPVSSFPLATSETWKDKNGNVQEHTDWHTIVAWRGLAEVIQKLVKKGSRVYIEGRIQTRSFEDKEARRRHITEILADNMLLLDQRKVPNGISLVPMAEGEETEFEQVAVKEEFTEPDYFDFSDSLDDNFNAKSGIEF